MAAALVLVLAWTTLTMAQNQELKNPQSLFFQANGAYQKGDYQKAAEIYQELIQAGYESGSLYYNMGNTYFKLGQRGPAILYYEKAKQLIPGDADLKSNLSYALSGVEEGNSDWKLDFNDFLTHLAPVDDLLIFSSIWFFLLVGLVIFFILFPAKIRDSKNDNRLNPWWLGAMIAAVGVFVMLVTVSAASFGEQSKSLAVAVKSGGEVRFEPKSEATVYYALSEGARVQILEKKGDWMLIKRRDGKRGWVERAFLEGI